MHFKNIPSIRANYVVDVFFNDLEETLERFNDRGQLELNPEFQRLHVWTEEQQRRFVLHMLRGGSSGRDVYFNAADWSGGNPSRMYLVDGKQRVEAVRRFLRDDLYIMPDWMPYNHPLGLRKSDFEGHMPLEARFRVHVHELQTYGEVVQWYYDLNAGLTPHTPEELQRALEIIKREREAGRGGNIVQVNKDIFE